MAEKPFIAKHGLVVREGASEGITFTDLGSSNSITIKSASSGAPATPLVLPNADGGAGDYLRNDGAGNLSWSLSGIGTMSGFTVDADSGGVITMADGNQLQLIGGTNIDSLSNPGGKTVTIDWAADLGDLGDVDGSAPTNGDVLTWNNSGSTWEPQAGGGGGSGAFTLATGSIPDIVHATGELGGTTTQEPNLVFGSVDTEHISGSVGIKRMLFDRHKGAFRAGGVTSTQWDDGSRGDFSIAFGSENTAAGPHTAVLSGSANTCNSTSSLSAITHGTGNIINHTSLALDPVLHARTGGTGAISYLVGQDAHSSISTDTAQGQGKQTSVITMSCEMRLDETASEKYTLDGAVHDHTKWTSGGSANAGGKRFFIRPNTIGGNIGYDATDGNRIYPFSAQLNISGTILWYGELVKPDGYSFATPIYNTIAVNFKGDAFIHRTGGGHLTKVFSSQASGSPGNYHGSAVWDYRVLYSGHTQYCSDGRYPRVLGGIVPGSWTSIDHDATSGPTYGATATDYDGTSSGAGTTLSSASLSSLAGHSGSAMHTIGDPGHNHNHNHTVDPHRHDMEMYYAAASNGFNRGGSSGHYDNWLNYDVLGNTGGAGLPFVFPTTSSQTNSGGDHGWYVVTPHESKGRDEEFTLSMDVKTEADYLAAFPTSGLTHTDHDGVWVEFALGCGFSVYNGSQASGVNIRDNWKCHSTLRIELAEATAGLQSE